VLEDFLHTNCATLGDLFGGLVEKGSNQEALDAVICLEATCGLVNGVDQILLKLFA